VADIDLQSRLTRAVAPVVDQLEDELAEMGFCVIVADERARLIQVRSGQHRLTTELEKHGIAIGRRWPNGRGTALQPRVAELAGLQLVSAQSVRSRRVTLS
jgi:transcriptional regulator of acetoin/glycerol metabolism